MGPCGTPLAISGIANIFKEGFKQGLIINGGSYASVIRIESYLESILCNVIFIARHSYKFYSNLHEEIGVARQGPYKYWIERLVLIILRNPPATTSVHSLRKKLFTYRFRWFNYLIKD